MDCEIHVTTHLSAYGGKENAIRKMARAGGVVYAAKHGQFYGGLDRYLPTLGRIPLLNVAVLTTHLVRALILRVKMPRADCCHDAYTALLYRCRYYVHEDYHRWRDPLSALLRRAIHLYAMRKNPTYSPNPADLQLGASLWAPPREPIQPCPPPSEDGVITVGYHGRVEPVKRLHLVVDAVARLRQEGRSAELAVMGDGPALADVVRRAKARGVPLRLHPPTLSRDAIRRFLCQTDVYVNYSAAETFSLSTAEAAEAGRPLVLSPIPTFRLIYGRCAYIAESPHEIPQKILQAHEERRLCSRKV